MLASSKVISAICPPATALFGGRFRPAPGGSGLGASSMADPIGTMKVCQWFLNILLAARDAKVNDLFMLRAVRFMGDDPTLPKSSSTSGTAFPVCRDQSHQ